LVAIFGEVLQPALYEIGSRWQDGRFLVAQEKEASELLRDIIAELSHRHDPGPSGSFVVVAGCVQGERHELGLRMITGLLRSRGFRVHSLGADVNAAFFSEAVRLHRPEALLLSVKLVQNLDRVREVAESIRAALDPEPPPLVLVGGEAVGSISERLAGVNVTVVQGSSLAGVIDSLTWHLESARGTRRHPEST
jgi:methanogenic corrinoid protein MtbC1